MRGGSPPDTTPEEEEQMAPSHGCGTIYLIEGPSPAGHTQSCFWTVSPPTNCCWLNFWTWSAQVVCLPCTEGKIWWGQEGALLMEPRCCLNICPHCSWGFILFSALLTSSFFSITIVMLITLKNRSWELLFPFLCLPHLHTYHPAALSGKNPQPQELSIWRAGLQPQWNGYSTLTLVWAPAATTSLVKFTFWFLELALESEMAVLLADGVTACYWGDWGPLLGFLVNERF